MRPWRIRGDDRGTATVAAVAMVAALLAVTSAAVCLGSAVVARHRAQAAADLAALAAATWLPSGAGTACQRAATVVRRMAAECAGCRVDGLDVVVTVEIPVVLAGWGAGPARAVARAGPE
ncbi:MAG TPA: Rv3654c family TadE-like protein [Mycobacterium sp.]